ncbi:MAG: Arc family DNA-binding protein [Bacillota bacterium]|jgi:hypothetical protein|nr:Arc family DNA-binding protein [Bacillota bacterium]NLU54785.1 Arc family DNA-binding protein [Bacillota bacterium]HOA91949.1 Arc family DNA-binding protein [Bacillota bacterium]HOJ47163.1 Arc family DNA-binding protein [Bacillota bacterium]HOL14359.1 Arc family DNA-binding protein [Bacillota bacterium]
MSKNRKQVPLRLPEELYNKIAAWAEEDFRSINGQIEYLLTLCVRQKEKTGRYTPQSFSNEDTETTEKETP